MSRFGGCWLEKRQSGLYTGGAREGRPACYLVFGERGTQHGRAAWWGEAFRPSIWHPHFTRQKGGSRGGGGEASPNRPGVQCDGQGADSVLSLFCLVALNMACRRRTACNMHEMLTCSRGFQTPTDCSRAGGGSWPAWRCRQQRRGTRAQKTICSKGMQKNEARARGARKAGRSGGRCQKSARAACAIPVIGFGVLRLGGRHGFRLEEKGVVPGEQRTNETGGAKRTGTGPGRG